MTVKELISQLSQYPDDMEVRVFDDIILRPEDIAEGNNWLRQEKYLNITFD